MTARNSETLSRSESIHLRRDVVTVFTKTDRLLLQTLYTRFVELTARVTPIPAMAIKSLFSIAHAHLIRLSIGHQANS